MRRIVVVALGLALGVLGLAAPAGAGAAAPKPGVFAGSLGVTVPRGGSAVVRAIEHGTGRLVAGAKAGRGGRFSLTLPPGAYAVASTIVSRTGRRTTQPLVGLTLKSGQRRTKVSLKKAKRPKKKRKHKRRARAAFVQELGQVTPGRLAVVLPYFTGLTDQEGDFLQKGLADLLTTDLINLGDGSNKSGGGCRYSMREINRLADVQREIDLSQSRYADPATRITRNMLIPDVEIRGTLKRVRAPLPAGQRFEYETRLVDARTGKELSRLTGSLPIEGFFEAAEELARNLSKEICKLSDVYEVKLDLNGTGTFATHDARGALHSTLRARRGSEGGGAVWRDSGTLIWEDLDFTPKTACKMIDWIAGVLPWSVTIIDTGSELQVTWLAESNGPAGMSTASIDCPPFGPDDPDPPPIPGQPGPALLAVEPATFTVPYTGGTQPISGGVVDGADGFRNSGTITVTPAGVAAARE
jgi:hypothetical protein